MVTRKLSKGAKAAAALAKIAEELGVQLDMSGIEYLRNTNTDIETHSTREAESVMRSLHSPHAYTMKKCKRCIQPFQTNYCSTAYCSDTCLAADMKNLGLSYDPYRLRRWESSMYSSASGIVYRYEPPEFISTDTVLMLEEYAMRFLADLTRLRAIEKDPLEVERQQEQKMNQDFPAPLNEKHEVPVKKPALLPTFLQKLNDALLDDDL